MDQALSYRLESAEWLPSLNLIDTLRREEPEAGAEREMVAGGWMMYAGPQSPLNHVVGMGLGGAVSNEEFDRVEDFYRRHESICEVVVSPYSDMSLTGHLGARGYRVTEWNSVLFRELDHAGDCEAPGVEVRAVRPERAREWSALVARGSGDLTGVSAELFVPFATAPNAICCMAYLDGQPAGGAGGSVFPEAGCELAVVCAAPGSVSERNARRNGFRLACTKAVFQRQL
jgi:hypothetical protein